MNPRTRSSSSSSFFLLSSLSLSALLIAGCQTPVNRTSTTPLTTVEAVDPERYVGRWYEIARLPNSFEEGCEGVTADYARRADGLLRVVNTCREGSPAGTLKSSTGRARIVDETTNAKLEVSFFGPFWGDYWILDLADDYAWAIVGEPEGRYLWVLSRTPTISAELWTSINAKLTALGYDVSAVHLTAQPPVPDNPLPPPG